jgi:hypothetical protein
MSKQDIAFVATRILALYFFVQAIIVISPMIVWALTDGNSIENGIMYIGSQVTVIIVMAVLLWFFAGIISRQMVGASHQNDKENDTKITALDFWGLGFALVGIFAILSSIEDIALGIYSGMAELVSGGLKMGLGIYLVLGWRGLVSWLIRMRTAGIKPNGT